MKAFGEIEELWTGTAFFDDDPHMGVRQAELLTDSAMSRSFLSLEVAFVITFSPKREGDLVPILLFFIFVAMVCIFIIALGYVISTVEERTESRRCRMTHEMHRRRKLRRQRVQCRFEG